jgi:hypothetical protein
MAMDSYLMIFQKDTFVRVSTLYNIISIFDSVKYDRSDQELLSASQRNHIGKILEENDHKRLTGNSYQNINTKKVLRFTTPKMLGVSPLNELQYNFNKEDIFIVTPGTYFLFLVMKFDELQKENILKEIMQLISIHPVNLDQLLNVSRHEVFYPFLKQKFPEFVKHQQNAIKYDLKDQSSLGSNF